MDIIPLQEKGKQYDTIASVICDNAVLADNTYKKARKKLLAINSWGKTGSSILQTDFFLCDAHGNEVDRTPEVSDHIKIDLLGPGSKSGDGFDWVQIEEIFDNENDSHGTLTSIKVRPAVCPTNDSKAIAHFFDEDATSTFIVSKKENEVVAEIHGRNEEPNKINTPVVDKVRNALVATFAKVKFSDIQWKSLCEGFLA